MGATLPPASETVFPLQVGILGMLFALAMIAYLARMISRSRPYLNLGWDDFAISVAVVSCLQNTLR